MGNPWRRLLGVLREKRELYERYRQEAVILDDVDLQSLLHRLCAEEARHQEDLVEILTHLDAHVHETIA
jgi:rubrerythrin